MVVNKNSELHGFLTDIFSALIKDATEFAICVQGHTCICNPCLTIYSQKKIIGLPVGVFAACVVIVPLGLLSVILVVMFIRVSNSSLPFLCGLVSSMST